LKTFHPKNHRVLIEGGGIAGQVLRRELSIRGVECRLKDVASFPRPKVCGGILQWDTWEYLNSRFTLNVASRRVDSISHHWRGHRLSHIRMPEPMMFVSRLEMDAKLNSEVPQSSGPFDPTIRILASGAPRGSGDWIGFQAEAAGTDHLEMYYAPGIYLGRSPTPAGPSHVGFIVRRTSFDEPGALPERIVREFGIELHGRWKGTTSIHYGRSGENLAVGDAKLTTHPFLGFGMKHAVDSARLLAGLIADGRVEDYDRLHRRLFGRVHRVSRILAALYGSPAAFLLRPLAANRRLFLAGYRWIHRKRIRSAAGKPRPSAMVEAI